MKEKTKKNNKPKGSQVMGDKSTLFGRLMKKFIIA